MTNLSLTLEGAAPLRAALLASGSEALHALGGAVYVEANEIMADSKPQVPVKEGILRASGTVQPPIFTSNSVEVTFGYGGAARAYAIIQHERTDFHHRVGKDHYLSDPLNARISGMEERLAARVASQRLFPGLP